MGKKTFDLKENHIPPRIDCLERLLPGLLGLLDTQSIIPLVFSEAPVSGSMLDSGDIMTNVSFDGSCSHIV